MDGLGCFFLQGRRRHFFLIFGDTLGDALFDVLVFGQLFLLPVRIVQCGDEQEAADQEEDGDCRNADEDLNVGGCSMIM